MIEILYLGLLGLILFGSYKLIKPIVPGSKSSNVDNTEPTTSKLSEIAVETLKLANNWWSRFPEDAVILSTPGDIPEYPGIIKEMISSGGLHVEGKIYRKFLEYDPVSDQWSIKLVFPGKPPKTRYTSAHRIVTKVDKDGKILSSGHVVSTFERGDYEAVIRCLPRETWDEALEVIKSLPDNEIAFYINRYVDKKHYLVSGSEVIGYIKY